jgi:hypothetical protein
VVRDCTTFCSVKYLDISPAEYVNKSVWFPEYWEVFAWIDGLLVTERQCDFCEPTDLMLRRHCDFSEVALEIVFIYILWFIQRQCICIASNNMMYKRLWPIWTTAVLVWRFCWKPRPSVRIGGVLAEIRTGHFRITNQKHYRLNWLPRLLCYLGDLCPLKTGLGVQFQHWSCGFEFLCVCWCVFAFTPISWTQHNK